MKNINLTTQYISFVLLLFISNLSPKQALVERAKLAADCPRECGGVSIKYPFGIGSNCSLDDNFSIYCNTSFNPPKPFLESINLELKNISVLESTVQVNSPVFSNCQDQGTTGSPLVDLSFTPYSFSGSDNVFTAVGCNSIALLTKDVDEEEIIGGCMSYCHGGVLNTSRGLHSCFGVDCCQTTIPWPQKVLNVSFQSTGVGGQDNLCHYALMVRKTWLAESDLEPNIYLIDRLGLRYVPAVLDWAINIDEDYGSCSGIYLGINNGSGGSGESICGSQAHCFNTSEGYVCVCNQGYAGNPYDTCVDRDECANGSPCEGGMICANTPGGYNCSCRFGYTFYEGSCNPIPYEYIWILAMIGQGGGLMILLGCLWGLHRVYETRKDKRLKKKYFRLNGGLLLQERISSSEDTVKKIQLFTSKELEKATDDYNRNRIVGRGGQGTVFKGMLTDGRVVAVKLSKPLEEKQVKNFINEVIILSTINHRNVVKILGCCLESKLPMLVYEFIPNGTLSDYIQGKNEEIPFSWDVRFQIAIEIAVTLCYLHSHAEKPIFHRDIKSTNILLDERFRAKVADFGISMSVSIDQTHMTTMVRGTFGYLDPEYFHTKMFTEKSDVYSFGVVLAELLTGLKPIFPSSSDSNTTEQDHKSLAAHFVHSMEKQSFLKMVDARIAEVARKGEIMAVANVAWRCLNLDGKKRPTMKAVAMELEWIRIKRSESTSRLSKLATKSMNTVMTPKLCSPSIF